MHDVLDITEERGPRIARACCSIVLIICRCLTLLAFFF